MPLRFSSTPVLIPAFAVLAVVGGLLLAAPVKADVACQAELDSGIAATETLSGALANELTSMNAVAADLDAIIAQESDDAAAVAAYDAATPGSQTAADRFSDFDTEYATLQALEATESGDVLTVQASQSTIASDESTMSGALEGVLTCLGS